MVSRISRFSRWNLKHWVRYMIRGAGTSKGQAGEHYALFQIAAEAVQHNLQLCLVGWILHHVLGEPRLLRRDAHGLHMRL